jgi:hypothetical protein
MLVEQQQQQLISGAGEKRIHWEPIAKELDRSTRECKDKWVMFQRSLRAQSLKTGPFSPQEDATIVARVAAWDTSKTGLWSGLERELGRTYNNIRGHWRHTLSKR